MLPFNLREERKKQGWSQSKLAKRLGVTTRTVIRWEKGISLPRPWHRKQLENLFEYGSSPVPNQFSTDMEAEAEVEIPNSFLKIPLIPDQSHTTIIIIIL